MSHVKKLSISIAAVSALLIAGCGSSKSSSSAQDNPSTSGQDSSTTQATTTTVPAQLYALTGLPVTDPAKAARPALTVKIDGAPAAQPQIGLDKADVVFEEMVEGGAVRYLAMFQSQDSDPVGPVRSIRPVDPDIVAPAGGLFAYSGGIPIFVDKLRSRTYLKDVGASVNGDDFYRRKIHSAPHNLYSSTPKLYEGAPEIRLPNDLFAHLAPEQSAGFGGTAATTQTSLKVDLSSLSKMVWTWDATRSQWLRTFNGKAHTVEGGSQIGATNVVLATIPYVNTGSFDPVGTPVPGGQIIGTGKGYVASSGGKVVSVTWTKSSAEAPMTFTDSLGTPVKLAAGTTWATLLPTTGTVALA